MAVRNNIGKIKNSLETISRQANLFFGLTQYGLGTVNGVVPATADNVNEEIQKDFLWGIHRWGSEKYRIGK